MNKGDKKELSEYQKKLRERESNTSYTPTQQLQGQTAGRAPEMAGHSGDAGPVPAANQRTEK